MGIPRAFLRFERDCSVRGSDTSAVVNGKRSFTKPAPQAVKMAITTDQAALRSIAPGLIGTGRSLGYVREDEVAVSDMVAGATVWWTSENDAWEIESVDDFDFATFGRMGGFKRLLLKRVGV